MEFWWNAIFAIYNFHVRAWNRILDGTLFSQYTTLFTPSKWNIHTTANSLLSEILAIVSTQIRSQGISNVLILIHDVLYIRFDFTVDLWYNQSTTVFKTTSIVPKFVRLALLLFFSILCWEKLLNIVIIRLCQTQSSPFNGNSKNWEYCKNWFESQADYFNTFKRKSKVVLTGEEFPGRAIRSDTHKHSCFHHSLKWSIEIEVPIRK